MQINAFLTTPAPSANGKDVRPAATPAASPSPSFAKVLSRQKEQAAKPAAEAKETSREVGKAKAPTKTPAHAAEPTELAHRADAHQPAKPVAKDTSDAKAAKDDKATSASKRGGEEAALPKATADAAAGAKADAEGKPAPAEADAPADGMNPWMALMQTLSAAQPPAAPAAGGDGGIALTASSQSTVDPASMLPVDDKSASPLLPAATASAKPPIASTATDPAALATALAAQPDDAAGRFGHTLAASLAAQPDTHATGSEWRARERDAASTALPTASIAGLIATAPSHSATQAPEPVSAASTVNLPVPVDSPEFAPSLAATVSVLARDGVQEARINLHPAEMGPITVQIAVDGTQARVDFSADMAATRSVLEAGLPELASALRDAGLTLSGGGVFDQAQSGRQGNGGETAGTTRRVRGSGAAEAEGAAMAVSASSGAPRRVTVYGLDEYA